MGTLNATIAESMDSPNQPCSLSVLVAVQAIRSGWNLDERLRRSRQATSRTLELYELMFGKNELVCPRED